MERRCQSQELWRDFVDGNGPDIGFGLRSYEHTRLEGPEARPWHTVLSVVKSGLPLEKSLSFLHRILSFRPVFKPTRDH